MTLSFGASCDYGYVPGDCIGRGAFGNVYQATITKRGSFRGDEIVAVKVIHLPGDSPLVRKPENWEKYLLRLRKLLDLQHGHLVRYHKVSVTNTLHGKVSEVVMDYCNGRDLALLLKDLRETNSTLMYADVIRYTLEITDGLQYLHKNYVIHGDLKPANILLKCPNGGHHTLLIGDLDDCVQMHNPVTTARDISHYRGTVRYMSPEMLQKYVCAGDSVIGRKTDVWSLGCIIAEMINYSAGNFDNRLQNWRSGEMFHVENNTPNHLIAGKILGDFAPYIQNPEGREIESCVESCFSKTAKCRITASELLEKIQKFGTNGSLACLVDKATRLRSGEEAILQDASSTSEVFAHIPNELLLPKFVDDLRFVTCGTINAKRTPAVGAFLDRTADVSDAYEPEMISEQKLKIPVVVTRTERNLISEIQPENVSAPVRTLQGKECSESDRRLPARKGKSLEENENTNIVKAPVRKPDPIHTKKKPGPPVPSGIIVSRKLELRAQKETERGRSVQNHDKAVVEAPAEERQSESESSRLPPRESLTERFSAEADIAYLEGDQDPNNFRAIVKIFERNAYKQERYLVFIDPKTRKEFFTTKIEPDMIEAILKHQTFNVFHDKHTLSQIAFATGYEAKEFNFWTQPYKDVEPVDNEEVPQNGESGKPEKIQYDSGRSQKVAKKGMSWLGSIFATAGRPGSEDD